MILLVEINASTCQLAREPDVIMRGTALPESKAHLTKCLHKDIAKALSNQKGAITNRVYIRSIIGTLPNGISSKNSTASLWSFPS